MHFSYSSLYYVIASYYMFTVIKPYCSNFMPLDTYIYTSWKAPRAVKSQAIARPTML